MKRIVKQVGMIDLFTEQADLSGITEEPGLMVSKVSQHMKHSDHRICLFPEPDINIPWKAYPILSEASLNHQQLPVWRQSKPYLS